MSKTGKKRKHLFSSGVRGRAQEKHHKDLALKKAHQGMASVPELSVFRGQHIYSLHKWETLNEGYSSQNDLPKLQNCCCYFHA